LSSSRRYRQVRPTSRIAGVLRSTKFIRGLGYALLILSLAYGSYLRLQIVFNSSRLGYGPTLYELDPFQEYFVASVLLEHGFDYLSQLNHYNNITRIFWYPWGRDFTHSVYVGLPLFAIATYHVAKLFNPGLDLYEWMVYLPVLFFAIAAVGLYLSVRELSGDLPAGLATLGYSLMFNSRQLAGFTVKYSIGLAFLSVAVFLHIRAWKRGDHLSAALAGAFLGFSALGWAGFNVVFAAMVAQVVLLPLVREPRKEDLVIWTLEYLPLLALQLSAPTYGLRYVVRSVGLLGPASLAALVVAYLLYTASRRRLVFGEVLVSRPKLIYALLIVVATLGGLYLALSGGLALAGKALAAVGLGSLAHVLVETVAEYQPSGAQEVLMSVGAAAVYGVIAALYVILKSLTERGRTSRYGWYVVIASFLAFIAALVYSQQAGAIGRFALSAAIAVGLTLSALAARTGDEELFAVILLALSAVGTINIAYFTYLFALSASILTGYLLGVLLSRVLTPKPGFMSKLISATVVAAFILALLSQASLVWVRAYSTQLPTIVEASLGLNVEAPVWLDALRWIRENTPEDSVVVSWWDYGYWISVVGRRASVADGATINVTQIEILARALTSSEEEALDTLVKYFRIRPDRLYVAAYEVFLVDVATNSFYPGPLLLGGSFLGADAAKGIAAIYKIAGREPPVYVYTDPNRGIQAGFPDWTSENLRSALLYKILLDSAYNVWGAQGYRARFLYRDPYNPPEIPSPTMSFFEPAYISTSLVYSGGQYSIYVLLAVYRVKVLP
jgi:dolichyl-diphosphooligosaccharide--protein glycosyltransferase